MSSQYLESPYFEKRRLAVMCVLRDCDLEQSSRRGPGPFNSLVDAENWVMDRAPIKQQPLELEFSNEAEIRLDATQILLEMEYLKVSGRTADGLRPNDEYSKAFRAYRESVDQKARDKLRDLVILSGVDEIGKWITPDQRKFIKDTIRKGHAPPNYPELYGNLLQDESWRGIFEKAKERAGATMSRMMNYKLMTQFSDVSWSLPPTGVVNSMGDIVPPIIQLYMERFWGTGEDAMKALVMSCMEYSLRKWIMKLTGVVLV